MKVAFLNCRTAVFFLCAGKFKLTVSMSGPEQCFGEFYFYNQNYDWLNSLCEVADAYMFVLPIWQKCLNLLRAKELGMEASGATITDGASWQHPVHHQAKESFSLSKAPFARRASVRFCVIQAQCVTGLVSVAVSMVGIVFSVTLNSVF